MGGSSPSAFQAWNVTDSPEISAWKAEYARELGLNLQRLRAERGMSQERVAHLAGLSAYTYQKYEKGESRPGTPMNPRLFNLIALAEVLEAKLADLLPTS